MHDSFLDLLQSPGHWMFEIFLMILFDGILNSYEQKLSAL